MTRILFLITGFNYAGAENQIVQLCRGFRAKGYDIALVSMIEPVALTYVNELKELNVEIHSLGMSKGIPDPRAIIRLRRVIKQFNPDVVHSHLVHANILARFTRMFVKMPLLICTAHNIHEGGRFRELLYRFTDPLCELTTNVSEKAVQRYIDERITPKNKIVFIPNGIDISQFEGNAEEERRRIELELGISKESFIWFAAGRIVPEKDYSNMLTAFSKVTVQHPDSVLLIAGIGPEREMMDQLCKELGIQDQVHFLGIRHDIAQLMKAADAYLMSSKWEGMPIVLLEASASALPIVATDVGGNREVVQDGLTGLLVRAEDSDELSDRMASMMSLDANDRQLMGQAGRQYVKEHYSMNEIVETWTDIYSRGAQGQGVVS